MTRAAAAWCCIAALAYAGLAWLGKSVGPWSEHLGAFLALYALAWIAALLAARAQPSLRFVLGGAILFRLLLVALPPYLSPDIFRYVWEGRIQNAGFDPFLLPPRAPELALLRDALWSQVNYPDSPAIYPPVAQLAFRALASLGGMTLFKLAFAALDVAMIAVLGTELRSRGRALGALVLYAWGPLAVIEIAGSGHIEPLGLLPLVFAVMWVRRRPALAWAALTCSILVRYASVLVLPFVLQEAPPRPRRIAAALLIAALACAPYAGAGTHLFDSLRMYADRWRYNDLMFSILQATVPSPREARWLAAALLVCVCITLLRSRLGLETRCLAALGAGVALSPTIHPWYLLWPLALTPLQPSLPMYVWSGSIALSYLFLYPAFGIGPLDKESWGLKLLEMAPVAIVTATALARRASERVHACRTASS